MNFMSQLRYNPKPQKDEWYYRIKESYRDQTGRPRNRVMLNVGFIPEPHRPEDIRDIGKCLTYRYNHQTQRALFESPFARYNEFVRRKTEEFWTEMVNNGSIDAVKEDIRQSREKARRLVDVDTVKHTDAREIGAEWICLQAIRELEIDKFLEKQGWSEVKINTALAHLITRTVYSPSELKSMRIMDENSAVCELDSGIYFLRTNVATFDEKTTWDYYNLTREIECTNRQLKTDLNLRPIHHQKDERSDAHLFFGLLAYWVVNTIRYRLKQSGMTHYWSEIVRTMSTQKAITTEATNVLGETVHLRQCSEPTKAATDIYERLKYKKMPFRKFKIDKICSTQ